MLETKINGVNFSSCLMNASGARCETYDELIELGKSKSSAIVSKSSTLEFRNGNEFPRYKKLPFGSINSMGIPNLGYKKYIEFASELKKNGKPYIVSVSGLSESDNIKIIKEINSISDIDFIELNLSCPNIIGKPQVGYDFIQTKILLEKTFEFNKKKLGVKLPPYFDFVHFEEVAKILNQFPLSFVTCINSIGNGLFVDIESESVVIKPKGGFGGIGGKYVKPTALANVRKFFELLNKNIAIIGVGGIETGIDVFEFLLCGASAVQIGTTFVEEGAKCFERIENELREILKQKNYKTIDDVIGKLKLI